MISSHTQSQPRRCVSPSRQSRPLAIQSVAPDKRCSANEGTRAAGARTEPLYQQRQRQVYPPLFPESRVCDRPLLSFYFVSIPYMGFLRPVSRSVIIIPTSSLSILLTLSTLCLGVCLCVPSLLPSPSVELLRLLCLFFLSLHCSVPLFLLWFSNLSYYRLSLNHAAIQNADLVARDKGRERNKTEG